MHQLHATQGDIARDKGTRILPRAQLKDERRNELQDKRWKFSQQIHQQLLTKLKYTERKIMSLVPDVPLDSQRPCRGRLT